MGEQTLFLPLFVISKVRHSIRCRREGQGAAAVGGRVVRVEHGDDVRGVGLLHARENLIIRCRGGAADLLGDVGEVRPGGVGVGEARVGEAGLRDEAADERVGGVGIGVFVDGHAAGYYGSVVDRGQLDAVEGMGKRRKKNLPGRLAEQNHAVGVAAERADVLRHPLDGLALVFEAGVEMLAVQGGGVGEAEDGDAVAARGMLVSNVRACVVEGRKEQGGRKLTSKPPR